MPLDECRKAREWPWVAHRHIFAVRSPVTAPTPDKPGQPCASIRSRLQHFWNTIQALVRPAAPSSKQQPHWVLHQSRLWRPVRQDSHQYH
jgi:hypothetical protein